MKYVISNIGRPFQFAVSRDAVYSFDMEEPVAISDVHLQFIAERIGAQCLKEVEAPASSEAPVVAAVSAEVAPVVAAEQVAPAAEASTTAPASSEAPVVEQTAPLE